MSQRVQVRVPFSLVNETAGALRFAHTCSECGNTRAAAIRTSDLPRGGFDAHGQPQLPPAEVSLDVTCQTCPQTDRVVLETRLHS